MNSITYAALVLGVICILTGFISIRRATKLNHNNLVVSWFLIAFGGGACTFALFPESTATGNVLGFKVAGASALLFPIWIYGMKKAREAVKLDELVEQITQRDDEILRLKEEARRELAQQIQQRDDEILRLKKEALPAKQFDECNTHSYALKNAPAKKLGLITGDIMNVKCGDIWVSSENTNMEMARYFDRSVSAAIRYYGSRRDEGGDVLDDLIADELKLVKGNKFYVQPTSLFVTGPGQLSNNGVKQIFHVAAVHGAKPKGYRPVDDLEGCVRKALEEAEKFKAKGYTSILFPLLATGTARGDLEPISRRLIHTALTYLEKHPESTIETVYFLTWSDIDLQTCQKILNELGERVTAVKA